MTPSSDGKPASGTLDANSPDAALERFRLDGRVVVVTGASSGLGERFARVLSGVGARVVLAARRTERIEALAAELPGALAVTVDVASNGGPQALVDAVLDHHGRIDALVNNAGISRVVPAVDDDLDGFRAELAVDLVAPYELARRAARWWIEHDHPGVVVNLGSVMGAGSGGRLRIPGYAAAKGGLHNLTRELAVQWARKGIRVNAIAPAWFETEMNTASMFHTEAGRAYVESGTPMGRGGHVHELDGALLLLVSDAGSYLTGTVLYVDGGWTAQ
ncbi:MAG: SDR family oxidoreductase [Actinomycetota bacterium]|nr:SDR family oxidoreductase [Actinomycetota bacterium]MED6328642.1 SDR family oxidoreductase [Actinomycetota bacterium]MEE2957562.1 SDR family oxidoreductase [Actinomycetota bacterium]